MAGVDWSRAFSEAASAPKKGAPKVSLPSFPFPEDVQAEAARRKLQQTPPMPSRPASAVMLPPPPSPYVFAPWDRGSQMPPELYAAAGDQGPSLLPGNPPMPSAPAMRGAPQGVPMPPAPVNRMAAQPPAMPGDPTGIGLAAQALSLRKPVPPAAPILPPGSPAMGPGVTAAPGAFGLGLAPDALSLRKPAAPSAPPAPKRRLAAAKPARAGKSESDLLNEAELQRILSRRRQVADAQRGA